MPSSVTMNKIEPCLTATERGGSDPEGSEGPDVQASGPDWGFQPLSGPLVNGGGVLGPRFHPGPFQKGK